MDSILRSYKETSVTVADFTKKRDKQWIIPKGYKKTDESSKAKGQTEYNIQNKEVRRSVRAGKSSFVEEFPGEAETATARGELSTEYEIPKHLSDQSNTCIASAKDNQKTADNN